MSYDEHGSLRRQYLKLSDKELFVEILLSLGDLKLEIMKLKVEQEIEHKYGYKPRGYF